MENFFIEETKYTPEIKLDFNEGIVSFTGKSYPENTFEFYEPVMEKIKEYLSSKPENKIVFNLEIIYFNSSSSKQLFDFFDLIEEHNENNDIEVNWIYDEENESALEAGEDFQEDFEDLNINLVEK